MELNESRPAPVAALGLLRRQLHQTCPEVRIGGGVEQLPALVAQQELIEVVGARFEVHVDQRDLQHGVVREQHHVDQRGRAHLALVRAEPALLTQVRQHHLVVEAPVGAETSAAVNHRRASG